MSRAAWLLAAPGAWAGYTWGSHLLTLGSVWRGPRSKREIALTFDDGPDPEQTPRILDILAAHGARATFFLIGARAARWATLVRRIAEAGHDLGNHTWSHRSLWLSGPRETARQVRDGHDAIAEAAGAPPRFFRPPWGMTNLALFGELRTLGTPCVCASTAEPSPAEVMVTVAWELSWYQYSIDLSDSNAPVREHGRGHELDELPEGAREWNATADEQGRIALGEQETVSDEPPDEDSNGEPPADDL